MDNPHKMAIAVILTASAICATTYVTANASPLNTPLYTVRMEQGII